MKISKISLLAILAGLATYGASAQAQSTNTPPAPPAGDHQGNPKARLGKLEEDLGLTADQKPKFEAIMKDQAEQQKALRADTSLSADDKKTKGAAIHEAVVEKLKALLTPDQFAKYQELTKKHGKGGKGDKGDKGGKGGPDGAGAPSTQQ
jgi:periplasmic protein CpxP/Spy